MDPFLYFAVVLIVIIVAIIGLGIRGLKSVSEYERLVIFSVSGKFKGIRGPGLVWVSPFEKVHPYSKDATGRIKQLTYDVREIPYSVPLQDCITKDNVPIKIQPLVIYKMVDPAKTVLTIVNAEVAILELARTTLRAVVGDMVLADVIARREQIAQQLRTRLAQEAERWGVDVTAVEIADLSLPDEVRKAMEERKATIEKAEGQSRALVLDAQAKKEAAQSHKEAEITKAEAEKQGNILKAEGFRQAKILEAEGLEVYYKKLTELGKNAEIVLRYENIDALKKFAASPNEKLVILPFESVGAFSFAGLKFLEDTLPSKVKKTE